MGRRRRGAGPSLCPPPLAARCSDPAFGWWLVFLVVPVGLVLGYSFFERGSSAASSELHPRQLRSAPSTRSTSVLLTSLRIAAIATVVALLIGYPVAYFIATRPRRWRTPLLILVILPFWTSFLIRTYAWIVSCSTVRA
jgi:spermidine/putrescine transport system permease protein